MVYHASWSFTLREGGEPWKFFGKFGQFLQAERYAAPPTHITLPQNLRYSYRDLQMVNNPSFSSGFSRVQFAMNHCQVIINRRESVLDGRLFWWVLIITFKNYLQADLLSLSVSLSYTVINKNNFFSIIGTIANFNTKSTLQSIYRVYKRYIVWIRKFKEPFYLSAHPGGGVLGISNDGDDRRIFWGLKFSILGFFWVRKFGKYFFG